jgi:hypothetical protein
MDDSAESHVRPDDRGVRVAPEQRLHLREIHRLGARLRERHVHVVVEDHHEPGLPREIENPVHGRIR